MSEQLITAAVQSFALRESCIKTHTESPESELKPTDTAFAVLSLYSYRLIFRSLYIFHFTLSASAILRITIQRKK